MSHYKDNSQILLRASNGVIKKYSSVLSLGCLWSFLEKSLIDFLPSSSTATTSTASSEPPGSSVWEARRTTSTTASTPTTPTFTSTTTSLSTSLDPDQPEPDLSACGARRRTRACTRSAPGSWGCVERRPRPFSRTGSSTRRRRWALTPGSSPPRLGEPAPDLLAWEADNLVRGRGVDSRLFYHLPSPKEMKLEEVVFFFFFVRVRQ